MELEFLESYSSGNLSFEKGEVLIIDGKNDYVENLNRDYLILVYRGLRYDIKKESVAVRSL